MDCFASLAIRRMHVRDLAARCTRALPEVSLTLSKQRAQGMPGARCTRGLMCNGRKSAHMSIQGSGEHPTFPAQGKIKSRVKFYGALWTPQAIDHLRDIPITCHTPSWASTDTIATLRENGEIVMARK